MEISQVIETATTANLSNEMSNLINELILMQDCLTDSIKCMSGVQATQMHIEIKATTAVVQEFEMLGSAIHKPSQFSPYYWLMLVEEVGGVKLCITIAGTEQELQQVWVETQTH
jgi:hypothetical protein